MAVMMMMVSAVCLHRLRCCPNIPGAIVSRYWAVASRFEEENRKMRGQEGGAAGSGRWHRPAL
eukprot:scaffold89177_cov18-Tisochrysis_lutea.AAC.1